MRQDLAKRASHILLLTVMADVGIAAAKFAGAIVSGSASLSAEAIHSVVDAVNEFILWIGERRARIPPTPKHPIGHGRELFFWSFIVALMIFSLGGVYNIHEGVSKFHAKHLERPGVSLVILGISMVIEIWSYRVVLKEIRARARRPKVNLIRWFRRSTSSDLLVIFTEDLAAVLGLIIAAAGIVGSWVTGSPHWDAYGSIVIGVMLVFLAVALAREIQSLIVGESPPLDYAREIARILDDVIPGAKLKAFVAVQIGLGEVIANYKVTIGKLEKADDLIKRIHKFEKLVQKKFPEIRWQYVEPIEA